MKKTRLMYVHVGLSSFVKKDIAMLSEEFDLVIHYFDLKSKSKLPLSFLRQLGFLMKNSRKSEGIVIQFAGYHSYLPTILKFLHRKKTIIVMGGTDSVSFPSIQYGAFYNKYLKFFTRVSLKKATLLLPVSESLIHYKYTYSDNDFSEQGYLVHAPKTKTEVQTIYNGYDSDKWHSSNQKEEKSFLTIGADLGSRFGKKLKGIDLILEIAPKFPDCKFYIIGGDRLKEEVPQNVILVGNMPHDDLPEFIASKVYYLQLSMSEGFPNALCEGMLSGCVPIVSNVGAMPMIVDNVGFILKKKDSSLLSELINEALNSDISDLAIQARNRIKDNFTIQNRKDQLTKAIKDHIAL